MKQTNPATLLIPHRVLLVLLIDHTALGMEPTGGFAKVYTTFVSILKIPNPVATIPASYRAEITWYLSTLLPDVIETFYAMQFLPSILFCMIAIDHPAPPPPHTHYHRGATDMFVFITSSLESSLFRSFQVCREGLFWLLQIYSKAPNDLIVWGNGLRSNGRK